MRRRRSICCRGSLQSEQDRRQHLITTACGRRGSAGRSTEWPRRSSTRKSGSGTFPSACSIGRSSSCWSCRTSRGRAGGDWMKFHFWSGYAILTLLLFRIAWGCVGSTTARFSDFVKGPVACLAYLRDLLLGRRDLRCRPQSGGRRHGRAAALRRAGAGRRGPVLCRHRHRHGHRPALRPGRRQVDRPLHALPQLLGERAPDPGRPARAGGRRSISCGSDRT